MGQIIDVTGRRSGRLVGVRLLHIDSKTRRAVWLCKCDCGNTVEVHGCRIAEGLKHSCGCLRIEGLARGRAAFQARLKAKREAQCSQ